MTERGNIDQINKNSRNICNKAVAYRARRASDEIKAASVQVTQPKPPPVQVLSPFDDPDQRVIKVCDGGLSVVQRGESLWVDHDDGLGCRSHTLVLNMADAEEAMREILEDALSDSKPPPVSRDEVPDLIDCDSEADDVPEFIGAFMEW